MCVWREHEAGRLYVRSWVRECGTALWLFMLWRFIILGQFLRKAEEKKVDTFLMYISLSYFCYSMYFESMYFARRLLHCPKDSCLVCEL